MNNSIAWHDTFRTKYRVTKVICWNAYAIHASGLNWPIHPWWGHWDFRFFFLDRFWYQKILIFWIGCSLWLADFPFFSIWSPYLDSGFSSTQAAIMRFHWSRIAAKPVSDRLGFWELECEHLSVLTALHAVFGFDRIFCVCVYGFTDLPFRSVLRLKLQ